MGKAKGCLVVLGAVMAVGLVQLVIQGGGEPAPERTPEQLAADSVARWRRQERSGRIAYAQMRVKERAKDPDAVQFQNVEMYVRGDTMVVCGQYNAKNSFGAYAGFQTFVHIGEALVTAEDAGRLGAGVVNGFIDKCKDTPSAGEAQR